LADISAGNFILRHSAPSHHCDLTRADQCDCHVIAKLTKRHHVALPVLKPIFTPSAQKSGTYSTFVNQNLTGRMFLYHYGQ